MNADFSSPKLLDSVEAHLVDELARTEYASQQTPPAIRIPGTTPFGRVLAFSDQEHGQLTSLQALICRFASQQAPPRPLCLGVFGPPGSGKSFAVEEICSEANSVLNNGQGRGARLLLQTVNLTQLTGPSELAVVLARVASETSDDRTPVLLIDEFDANRDSAPYGWLSWFLAPMHDGKFVHNGLVFPLKRAVYFFAGGTTDSMAEFSALSRLPVFRSAKGPDFVSRLRGYLDVQGPNSAKRISRRAVLLHSELSKQAKRNGAGSFKVDSELVESLLYVGRFRHGARSISAIVELSDLGPETKTFGFDQLPADHLLALHVDRGPLDAKSIGGAIAMSGHPGVGGAETGEGAAADGARDERLGWAWIGLAEVLLDLGATLAFAGDWRENKGGKLMRDLLDLLANRKTEPWRSAANRHRPEARLESFLGTPTVQSTLDALEQIVPAQERERRGIRVIARSYLTPDERDTLNKWQLRVVERFRRRLAAAESSVARFAIGGVTERHGGRLPGIIEEVVLSLVLKKPIYLAGGFAMATADAGGLLGLGQPRTGKVPSSLRALSPKAIGHLNEIANELRPAPWSDLPVTQENAVDFLRDHAIGGQRWPDNGLTLTENRQLFQSMDYGEIATLVSTGLLRIFGTR